MTKTQMEQFKQVLEAATKAASEGAQAKLTALQSKGAQWAVLNGSEVVGTMFDLCGFAWVSFKGEQKFVNAFRKVEDAVSGLRIGNGYPTGKTLSFRTMRQEISVNEAAQSAGLKFLQDAGYLQDAYVNTRVD